MKQVIIVRSDLNMRRGKEAAQVAHASLAAVLPHVGTTNVGFWLNSYGGCKIVVSVGSEAELLKAYTMANSQYMICSLIQDAGRTEFNGVPTFTCAAIGPWGAEEIDAITGGMKLR
jgi:PTH2 family peptidyl-tRNA hydrolase